MPSRSTVTTKRLPRIQCILLVLIASAILLLCHCMSEPVSFTSFICCHCHDLGAGRIATTFFGTYRAAELHISRSRVCKLETACKGVRSVPVVYRDSKRAEDQEAGPVGAPGQSRWPVRQAGGCCQESNISALISDILVIRRQE